MAGGPQFNLKEYEESISNTFPRTILEWLNQMEDFRKAYEVNPELEEIFKKVWISEDLGQKGLSPSDWPEFGPVQKTLAEFKSAYDTFQKEMIAILQKIVPTANKKSR